jgi:YD repeat-containing protein
VKDANNNLTAYVYDGFDRLAQTNFPSATLSAGVANSADNEQYGYDAAGNRTSLKKRDGSVIGFSFDALNREVVKDIPGGAAADVYSGYDLLNRKLYARFASAGGSGIDYAYDMAGRLTSETTFGKAMAFQYDAASNRTRVTWADGYYAAYGYDALNRATTIGENGATSGLGLLASYSYDNLGRRTGIARGNGTSTSYGYDSASRLTSLAQAMPGGFNSQTWGFTYSPASQVLTRTASNDNYSWTAHPNSDSQTMTPDGLNRDAAIVAASGYDLNQNLIVRTPAMLSP